MVPLADGQTDERVGRQARLGGEADRVRQRAHQHRRVDEARVVGDEDHRLARRHRLPPDDRERAAGEPHDQPVPASDDPVGPAAARHGEQQSPAERRGGQYDSRHVAGEERPRGKCRPLRRGRAGRRRGQPQPLRRHAGPPAADASREPGVAGRAAPDLAAGGLGDRSGRRQHHAVGRRAEGQADLPAHRLRQGGARRVAGDAGLRHDDELLRAAVGIGHAERGHAAGADARDAAGARLGFVRVEVAARLDDQVLGAAGQEEVAAGEVAEVAAVEPAVRADERARRLFVAVVAGGRRRPPEADAPLDALGRPVPVRVEHRQLVIGQRAAARDEPQRGGIVVRGRPGAARRLERRAPHPVDADRAAERRRRESERALREAVDRIDGAGVEAAGGEALDEPAQGLRGHRLRAVQQHPDGAQIQPVQLVVRDARRAEVEGEVGGGRQRAAVGVQGGQPADRPGEERERRHQGQRGAEAERSEPGADEPHVVVQRQPAHPHVAGGDVEPAFDRADVGQQVAVRKQNPLRLPGAARGVLDEGGIAGRRRRGTPRLAGHRVRRHHRVERRHLPHEQPGHPLHRAERHQDARPGVPQDGRLAPDVLLDAVHAERRIERHRHAAGHQRADERREEPLLGPQHDGDRVAAAETARGEAAGDRLRFAPQPAVGERRLRAVLLAQMDVDALGRALGVPGQRFDDRPGRGGRSVPPRAGRPPRRAPFGRGVVAGRRDGGGQVGRRLRARHGRVAEPDPERAFQADQQLDPLETADAEVGLQGVAAGHGGPRAAPQLGHELGDDVEHLFLDAGAGRRRGRMRHGPVFGLPGAPAARPAPAAGRYGSMRRMVRMTTFSRGTSSMRPTRVVRTREMSSTTSIPSTTRPNTA